MPINNMITDHEKAEAVYQRNMARSVEIPLEAERKRKRLESAKTVTDEEGTQWTYVVEEDGTATILKCRTECAKLVIPAEIDGVQVKALEPDCCRDNPTVEEVEVADAIESIGGCAFRNCVRLRKAVLPRECGEYVSTWFRDCPNVEEIALPGQLKIVRGNVFDVPKLRVLVIGRGTEDVSPGMFEKSTLERVDVVAENPYLRSDGDALYSFDGTTLVALARPLPAYTVAPGTKVIARKALANYAGLETIELPDSVEEIGEYSISRSGITRFEAGPNLRVIANHAFYNCRKLESVHLNDGLREVGDSAFCGTEISELFIPASVQVLGGKLTDDRKLTYTGADRSFEVAPGSPFFLLDEQGGLYRKTTAGYDFVCMMNPDIEEYRLLDGTRTIDERAFYRHAKLRKLEIPEGLEVIYEAAFRGCGELLEAKLPSSMTRVDREAFLDSGLTSLYIGRNLTRVGENAFVTKGAHKGRRRDIKSIVVEDGNERFYMIPGVLMERRANGSSRALIYVEGTRRVEIPLDVTSVAAYAFNGAKRIKEFFISDRINDIEICGLAIRSCVEHLHIDLSEPVDGHDSVDLNFPNTARAEQAISLAFSMSKFVDVEAIVDHYDDSVVNTQSLDMANRSEMEIYAQAVRAIKRLKDPVLLSAVNKGLYEKLFTHSLIDSCVAIARHDDRQALDDLLELGYLNLDSINEVIERVGALQDAATTSHLLELKHRLVQESGTSYLDDFEL